MAALDRHLAVNGLRQLDRYVLGTWLRLFIMAALGLPLVAIFFNLTDMLSRLLDRGLTMREITISYVYAIPEYAFLVMPAAVLLATVFTVVGMGRHSELTAAKAGGQSFHRLMRPLFIAAGLAVVSRFRCRRAGSLGHGPPARDSEGKTGSPDPLPLQLRLQRRWRLGLHRPVTGHSQPPA